MPRDRDIRDRDYNLGVVAVRPGADPEGEHKGHVPLQTSGREKLPDPVGFVCLAG